LLLGGTVWDSEPVDLRVLGATAVAAVIAALFATLWPLYRTARLDIAGQLHGAGRTTRSSGTAGRWTLLLVQTTLSTALVALAGLFIQSLRNVRQLDLGIDTDHTILVSVDLTGLDTPNEGIREFYRRAAARVRAIPGVAAAGVTFPAPFMGNIGGRMWVPGRDTLPRLAGGGPYFFAVGPGTLEAYGVRLLEGRLLTEQDRRGSAPVVVITQRMAQTIWPGERAVGRCIVVGADSMPCREVVGVVNDVHRQSIDETPFFLYFSVLEQEWDEAVPSYLVVRTLPGARDLEQTIRKTLALERSDLPYVKIAWYRDLIGRQTRPWRLGASLLAVFAGLSLVIAAIGLYGVVAFGVSQRTRELGLRAALGASPGRLGRAVAASGVLAAAGGALVGVLLALLVGPRLQPLLFQTRAASPGVLALAGGVVLAVSLAATWIPSRRATRLDPTEALRAE
jgi:predicted permease